MLWIFSELLRGITGYSAPVNFPSVTEDERRRLFSHFAYTYSQCLSESFAVMPSNSVQWHLIDDYSDGTLWWTSPSVEIFQPVNFYSGQFLSPVLSQDVPLFGSMPIHDLFFEGDITEVPVKFRGGRLSIRPVFASFIRSIFNVKLARFLQLRKRPILWNLPMPTRTARIAPCRTTWPTGISSVMTFFRIGLRLRANTLECHSVPRRTLRVHGRHCKHSMAPLGFLAGPPRSFTCSRNPRAARNPPPPSRATSGTQSPRRALRTR